MGRIPEQVIENVRDRADIVEVVGGYIPLQARGGDHWGCCPFHQEKTPSFKVNAERRSYHCFGCHKSGNVFTFVMERENVDFIGAVRLLAQRYAIDIPEEESGPGRTPGEKSDKEIAFGILERIAQWYQQCLAQPEAEVARDYLQRRGIDAEWMQKFGLGYSPDAWDAAIQWGARLQIPVAQLELAGLVIAKENTSPPQYYDRFRGRLMFPIRDELGRVVGFSARTLEAEAKTAKYINSPETVVFHKNRLLYGLHLARLAFKRHGTALVCEGQLDVMACFRAGFDNAVCAQGTAFTENHAALLRRFTETVHFCFDADNAGQKAAVRSIQLAVAAGFKVYVVPLPEGDDPDSLLKRGGPEAVRLAVSAARDALTFLLERGRQQHPDNTPEDRSAISAEIMPVIAINANPVLRAAQCQWLAQALGLPEMAIIASLDLFQKQQARRAATSAGHLAPEATAAVRPGTMPEQRPDFSPRPGPAVRKMIVKGPSAIERAEKTLLDYCLCSPERAAEVESRLPAEELSSSPLGQALKLVLVETRHGDWQEAREHLVAAVDLITDPQVGEVVANPEFQPGQPPAPDPVPSKDEHQAREQAQFKEEARLKDEARISRTISDCLTTLHLQYLDSQIAKAKEALSTTTDDSEQHRLMLEIRDLATRRREHAQTRRG
jgi:DNA primase